MDEDVTVVSAIHATPESLAAECPGQPARAISCPQGSDERH